MSFKRGPSPKVKMIAKVMDMLFNLRLRTQRAKLLDCALMVVHKDIDEGKI